MTPAAGPSTVERVLLTLHTARHLTPSQLFYWPLRRLQRALPVRVRIGAGTPDAKRFAALAECVVRWGPGDSARRRRNAEAVATGVFRFVGHEEQIAKIDWTRRYGSHLWTFNLHYFDYALDLAWSARHDNERGLASVLEALCLDWIAQTADGRGDAWEPYTISMRVINWVQTLAVAGPLISEDATAAMWASINAQLAVLESRLEYHLGANHLQKNYSALFIAGGSLSGGNAARWRERGRDGLVAAIDDQVLPDGCHVERSPMYHAIALTDFLDAHDVARAWGEPLGPESTARLRAMFSAIAILSRPAGGLHLFNDCANGIARPRDEIEQLGTVVLDVASPRVEGHMELSDGGYFGFDEDGDRVLVDCGEPGPAHQPGHAHCDLLSFELDLGTRTVVVDSGTSGYLDDPLRGYQRSTRAHNTVEIAGREQSEVWGSFRMGRRAKLIGARASAIAGKWTFSGSYRPAHDRSVVHSRTISREAIGDWVITDQLNGNMKPIKAVSYLHLHPDFEVRGEEGARGRWTAMATDLHVSIEPFGFATVQLRRGERSPDQGWFAAEFGNAMPAPVLEMSGTWASGATFGYRIRVTDTTTVRS